MATRQWMAPLILVAGMASAAAQSGSMGPGMMQGAGRGGTGYGMMGQGMMWGYDNGPGMTWRYNALSDLTADQRKKIEAAEQDLRRQQWQTMEKMHALMAEPGGWGQGKFDEQAARKQFDAMSAQRRQMFENMLAARKRIDAVLTPKQREQLEGR